MNSEVPGLIFQAKEEFEPLPPGTRSFAPEWGVVLGSGLGSVLESADVALIVPFREIRDLPESTVSGHEGQLALGAIRGQRVAFAQGRVHLYEGFSATEVTAGVRLLAKLGVRRLLLTNAAGSANPDFLPGSWMMLADHLNLTGTTPLLGSSEFIDMSSVYSSRLRAHFIGIAAHQGVRLHEGIYAGLLGPQYETPAEVRMLQKLGADAIGMSTVLEAIQARALGLEIAAFSCLTNWAAGLSVTPLAHEEVLETGRAASVEFVRLLVAAIEGWPHAGEREN